MMKVRARASAALPSSVAAGGPREPRGNVEPGSLYTAFAALLIRDEFSFLILGDTGKLAWKLARHFDVIDGSQPANWRWGSFGPDGAVNVVCGYPLIAASESHIEGLALATPEAIRDFLVENAGLDLTDRERARFGEWRASLGLAS